MLRSRPAPNFLLGYGVSALPAGRRNHQMLQGLAGTPFPDQDERGTLGRSIVLQPGEQAVRQRLSGERATMCVPVRPRFSSTLVKYGRSFQLGSESS